MKSRPENTQNRNQDAFRYYLPLGPSHKAVQAIKEAFPGQYLSIPVVKAEHCQDRPIVPLFSLLTDTSAEIILRGLMDSRGC